MAVTEKNSSFWPDRRAFLSTGAAMVIAALAPGDGVAQEPEKTDRCSASDAGPENEKLRESRTRFCRRPRTRERSRLSGIHFRFLIGASRKADGPGR
jgi:hypothetical protein